MSRGIRAENRFPIGRFQPTPLFLERVVAYWIYVFKCWRIAFDWTVLLYIVVPALLFAGGTYRDWLLHPPAWMAAVPAALPAAVLAMLCGHGRFRTFAELGDGLLLNRIRKWRTSFTRLGLLYALVTRVLIAVFLTVFIFPLWNGEGNLAHTLPPLPLLSAVAALWGIGWLLLQDAVARRWYGWRKIVLTSAIRAVSAASVAAATGSGMESSLGWVAFAAAGALFAVAMWRLRITTRGAFLHELFVEKEAFLAAIGWMLRDTMDRKPLPRLSRPLLLSRSPALFKGRSAADRLAESWIKSLLRRFDNVRLLLFYTGLGVAAVFLVPLPLSIAVWLVLPALLLGWLQGQWRYWLSEDFISQFNWKDSDIGKAGEKARFRLTIPSVVLWAVIVGLRFGLAYGGLAWLAVLVLPTAGWFWLRLVNRIATDFARFRRPAKGRGRTISENEPTEPD